MKRASGSSLSGRAAAFLLARCGEVGGHLADAEVEPAHRAVADQGHPVFDTLLGGVDLAPGRRAGRLFTAEPGEAQSARHPQRGTADGVVDHQDGDRGASDDVERAVAGIAFLQELAHIAPDVVRDEALDPPLGYPDQHDGLVVLVQHRARDRALGVEPDEEMNGLARISHGARDIGVQEDVAPERGSLERLRAGRRALDRAEAIGTWHKLSGFNLGEGAAELDSSVRFASEDDDKDKQQQRCRQCRPRDGPCALRSCSASRQENEPAVMACTLWRVDDRLPRRATADSRKASLKPALASALICVNRRAAGPSLPACFGVATMPRFGAESRRGGSKYE